MYTRARYTRATANVIKVMYFLLYAGFAAWMTLFYVYLNDDCHLSGMHIGIIAATQQLNNLIFLPLWGMIADKFGRKKMFLFTLGVSILLLFVFMNHGSFLYFFLFMILFSAIYNPIASLLDAIALEMSNDTGSVVSFGQMRLWASLGWALSSAATGYFVKSEYLSLIFPISSALFLITWLISWFLYKHRSTPHHEAGFSLSTLKNLVVGDKRLMYFFIFICLFYILNSPIMMFINLYYNEIGGTNMHIGLAFAVQSLCELPFFFWGQKFIDRFGSRKLMMFTMLVAAVRMFLYGATSNPWMAIAIGSMHGITLGLFMVAAVDFVHTLVPSHQKSTGQSLLYTFLGLGTCIGNFANGFFKDLLSLKIAMLVNGGLIVVLVLSAITFLKVRKQRRY